MRDAQKENESMEALKKEAKESKIYTDLCNELKLLINAPSSPRPGFFDNDTKKQTTTDAHVASKASNSPGSKGGR